MPSFFSVLRALQALLFQGTGHGPHIFYRLGYFTSLALTELQELA